jgi:DNA-binding MarR family transcriptional regulator
MPKTKSPVSVASKPLDAVGDRILHPEAELLPIAGVDYGVLESLLGYSLRRAQNALYLDFYRATAAFDISPQRYAALVIIGANADIHQGLLAEAMGIDRSGALRLIDWLAGRGYVERRGNLADARRWGLHLSPAGAVTLAAMTEAVQQHDGALAARVAAGSEGTALKTLLDRFVETFEAR